MFEIICSFYPARRIDLWFNFYQSRVLDVFAIYYRGSSRRSCQCHVEWLKRCFGIGFQPFWFLLCYLMSLPQAWHRRFRSIASCFPLKVDWSHKTVEQASFWQWRCHWPHCLFHWRNESSQQSAISSSRSACECSWALSQAMWSFILARIFQHSYQSSTLLDH